ncbi:MAG: tetratricopeptide repeat protein [Prevotellaceae bacterium]|jgi:tetratricopeptide (TPR) repeat protein|nr:tetratricopeptide repeat protein [Prevotellaceae bacterium]
MPENRKYIEQSEKLVKRYENDRQHYFKLEEFIAIADYYALNNNYKNALEVNNTAEIFYPSSFELKTIKADLYIKNNEFEKAEKIIKDIEYNSDVITDVYILRGEICLKKRQYKSAEKLFDKAIELSDEKDFAIELICDFLVTMHQLQLAKKYLELAQKTIKNINPDLLYWLAKCYETEAEYGKAAKTLESMTEITPFDEYLWDELGDTYMLITEYEKAIKAFDFRLAVSDKDAQDTLINKAECLSIIGENDSAKKLYNKILDSEKENIDAMYGIAKCYEHEKLYDAAEKLYLNIIEKDKKYIEAYYGLALIYSEKNEFKTAEKFLRKAALGDKDILIEMSKLLLKQDKIEEAQQTIENFINDYQCTSDCNTWLIYAEIISKTDIEKAIEILEKKYTEIFYSLAEICYHLAYYHFKNNNIPQCLIYLERGLELDDKMIKPFFELCPEAKLNEQIMNVYLSFITRK